MKSKQNLEIEDKCGVNPVSAGLFPAIVKNRIYRRVVEGE